MVKKIWMVTFALGCSGAALDDAQSFEAEFGGIAGAAGESCVSATGGATRATSTATATGGNSLPATTGGDPATGGSTVASGGGPAATGGKTYVSVATPTGGEVATGGAQRTGGSTSAIPATGGAQATTRSTGGAATGGASQAATGGVVAVTSAQAISCDGTLRLGTLDACQYYLDPANPTTCSKRYIGPTTCSYNGGLFCATTATEFDQACLLTCLSCQDGYDRTAAGIATCNAAVESANAAKKKLGITAGCKWSA